MRERWLRVGVLAGALFAINVVARLVVRIGFGDGTPDDLVAQDRIGWVTWGAIGVVLATMAIIWGRARPLGPVIADLAVAAGTGCLLSVLIGPFVGGASPFADGAGVFFTQIWLYAGIGGGGAALGLLILIMLGQDYKSRSLKRFAQAKLSKPRRPVRR